MKVLGIDPGLKGALAVWNGHELEVYDVPIMPAKSRGNEVNLPALADIVASLDVTQGFTAVYIERNNSRPQEGVSSARKGGMVEGVLLGCVIMRCRNVFRVTPQKWKKAMALNSNKNYSRTKATETFPGYYEYFERVKDDGRAEAALLAKYGYDIEIKSRVRKRLPK